MKIFKILLSTALVGMVAFPALDSNKAEAETFNYTITVAQPELGMSITSSNSDANVNQTMINGMTPVLADNLTLDNFGNVDAQVSASVTSVDANLSLVNTNPIAAQELAVEYGDNLGLFLSDSEMVVDTVMQGEQKGANVYFYLGENTLSQVYDVQVTYTSQVATP